MTILRTQLASLARRPSRILLTGLALLVASFVIFGTVIARDVAKRAVLDDFSGTPQATDLVVGRPGDGTNAEALSRIRSVAGVAEAVGRTTSSYRVARQPSWLVVAADPGSGPLAAVSLIRGTYPTAANEVAVTPRTLDRLHLAVGSTVVVETERQTDPTQTDPTQTSPTQTSPVQTSPTQTSPTQTSTVPVTLKVTGVVKAHRDYEGLAFTTDTIALSLRATAGQPAGISQIDVRLAPGTSADTARSAIAKAAAPAGGRAEEIAKNIRTGAQTRNDEMHEELQNVNLLFTFISVFVAIAVLAAILVTTATFRIVFAQRMRQLALLRAIGARRRRLAGALAVEGAFTGLVAGVVGIASAAGLGLLLPRLLGVAVPGFSVTAAVGTLLGITAIAALSVVSPALAASRVSPLEALRSAATTSARRGIGAFRVVAGALLTVGAVLIAGVVAATLPTADSTGLDAEVALLLVVLSGSLAYVALNTLGPLLLRPVLFVVGWPLRRSGAIGRLASGGVGAAPRRAAAVSMVVALGVTMTAGILIGGASIRKSASIEMAGRAPADFVVSTDRYASDADRFAPVLPAATLDKVRARPELRSVRPYRTTEVRIGRSKTESMVTDVNPRDLSIWRDFGATSEQLRRIGPGRVAINPPTANESGLRVGDTVDVGRGDRLVRVEIAIVLQSLPLEANIIMDGSDLTTLGVPAGYSGLLADAATGTKQGRDRAYEALRSATGDAENATISSYADDRKNTDREINTILGVALGLVGLTVLVAVVGVATTTALSVTERIREAGMLRAIGTSRGRLRAMFTLEAGLYGAIGATIGLILAVPYSGLLIEVVSTDFQMVFPAWQLAAVVLVLALFTAVAGAIPAARAARVSPVTALGGDG